MSNPHKLSSFLRPAVLALAAASVVGCEDLGASDKTVVEKVDTAVAQIGTLPSLAPGEGVTGVTTVLTDAANKATDGSVKAVAAGTAAAVDRQAAYDSVLALKMKEAGIRRTLVELYRLAAQVNTGGAFAAGYLKADPKSAVTDLSSRISAMQGNPQAVTWGGEKASLPTLAAAKQDVSKLEGDIEQKQQQLADLTKKRAELQSTADVQSDHAKSLKGEEGVRAYGDAAETRRQADDRAVDIDLVQVQIDRLKSDLAVAKAQTEIVTAGVDSLTSQAKQMENGWVATQKAAEQQKQIAAAVVQGDEATKQSIKSTADMLVTQLDELKQARNAAIEQLNEAKKFADVAQTTATTYGQSIATRISLPGKDGEAYKGLKAVIHPQSYRLRGGIIQSDRGAMELAGASLYADLKTAVAGVKEAIASAGATEPESLTKIDTAVFDELLKNADTDLTEGASMLTDVESGDSPKESKDAAKAARLINFYDRLQLTTLKAATGDTSAKEQATQLIGDARALKEEMSSTGIALPPLPGELGTVTPPPAALPAPTPAATAPAGTPPTPPTG